MTLSKMFKPVALTVLIVLGFAMKAQDAKANTTEMLTVAGGCFWCVEADFEKVPGVKEVVSGFTGGDVANPSYRQVDGGGTGHVEAVEIQFDPDIVSRQELLGQIYSVD